MAPHYPDVPVTTGIEKQYRVVYFRPVAHHRHEYRMMFIEDADIVSLDPISVQDLPQHKTLVNCKAKPHNPVIAALVRQYCAKWCRAHKGWTMVAELQARDLVHSYGGNLTPVFTVLLERPIVQTALKTGTPRRSLRETIRSKLKSWARCGSKSERDMGEGSDTRPLLGKTMSF